MAFVNPKVWQSIMGHAPQGNDLYKLMGGVGQGMVQGSSGNGATFAQGLAGGVQGMGQAQQQMAQQKMYDQQLAQQEAEMARQARMQKILGDLGVGGGSSPDFASQVDTGPMRQEAPRLDPGVSPMQPRGPIRSQPLTGPNPDAWNAIFPELTQRVFQAESNGQHFNADGSPKTSSRGAIGIAQVMPGTAPEAAELAGLPWDEQRFRNDPEYNAALGSAYLNHMGGIFGGDPVLATAAYNGGQGNVNRWLEAIGDPRKGEVTHQEFADRIPFDETRDYVKKTGLPVLEQAQGQPAAGPARPAPQAPQAQQAPAMNGYQQASQQQAGGGLNLPPQARAILSAMDPDSASAFLLDQVTRQDSELPAETRRALFATGGDVQAAQELERQRLAGGEGGGVTTAVQTRMQTAELFRQADPSLSEEDALNLALGRTVVSRDPVSGQAQIVDKHTGNVLRNTTADVAQTQEAPSRQTLIPDDLDLTGAMGPRGWFNTAANRVRDAVGVGLTPEGEDVERAVQSLNNLSTQTMITLSQEVAGRPTNYLLEEFKRLSIEPAKLLQGDQIARERLRATTALINQKLALVSDIVANPDGFKPVDVSAARVNKSQLEVLQEQYQTALNSFEQHAPRSNRSPQGPLAPEPAGAAEAGSAPANVPAEVSELWEFMSPEDRALWMD